MKLKFLTLLITLLLLSTSTATAQIIKELPSQGELENFTASLTQDPYSINIANQEAIGQHPTWPHDIWSDPSGELFISFYYANASSQKGYTSVYFNDCGQKLGSTCGITFKLVEAYPGLEIEENDTEENDTEESPIEELNNTTQKIMAETPNSFEMNIKNESTGAQVNVSAVVPENVPEEAQKDYLAGIKHFFNAVLGWDL